MKDERGAHKILHVAKDMFVKTLTWWMGAPWGAQSCNKYGVPKHRYGLPGDWLYVRESFSHPYFDDYPKTAWKADWIDLAMLALDGAWRTGASPEKVATTLRDKLNKNMNRSWPDWRGSDPNKRIEHKKE